VVVVVGGRWSVAVLFTSGDSQREEGGGRCGYQAVFCAFKIVNDVRDKAYLSCGECELASTWS